MKLRRHLLTNFLIAASFAVSGLIFALTATMELARHHRDFVNGFFANYDGAKGTIWFLGVGLVWLSFGTLIGVLQPERLDKALLLYGEKRVRDFLYLYVRFFVAFELLLLIPILDVWMNAGK